MLLKRPSTELPIKMWSGIDDYEKPVWNVCRTSADGPDVATLQFTVQGVNDPPNAVNDNYTVAANEVLTGNVMDNDSDPDVNDTTVVTKVTVAGVDYAVGEEITLPSGALLTVNADGTFTYNPNGVFDALGEGEEATNTVSYEIANPQD